MSSITYYLLGNSSDLDHPADLDHPSDLDPPPSCTSSHRIMYNSISTSVKKELSLRHLDRQTDRWKDGQGDSYTVEPLKTGISENRNSVETEQLAIFIV